PKVIEEKFGEFLREQFINLIKKLMTKLPTASSSQIPPHIFIPTVSAAGGVGRKHNRQGASCYVALVRAWQPLFARLLFLLLLLLLCCNACTSTNRWNE